tara:strand:+ start:1643 stop:2230 length:588 start_codon:yes stop_codon:yes gene_type:complete
VVTADTNPFRVSRIESLAYRAPGFTWEAFLNTLATHQYRGAIVGPHGTGKTTLMLETQERLAATGLAVTYGFLNEETPRPGRVARRIVRDTPKDTVLILDGAEQLDALTWRWVCWTARRLRGFIVTTHTPGRLPTLYRTQSCQATLRELLGELNPEDLESRWPRAREHFNQNKGNIRDVFFDLYDDCTQTSGKAD